MSRFVSLLRRTFGVMKEHVGTDHFGNKYYCIPDQKTWTGRVVRARRFVEASDPIEFEYLEGRIPSEWDAWIRGRRKDPPTIEELLNNERYREQIKIKAQEVEGKDKEHEEDLVAQPMQTQVKGHAAATHFGQSQLSEEPVSTANTFQPGSWAPPKK
ncbi:hypothetical protein QTP70_030969 [Hemibagrus guttatus]|uniref:NADH dehydrogenase [ubiquinone] 1 alpha subcomplex assembly factor 2 n=1 Tax=Hemibagrus guttatus TaxID=175788 RepID=A0AAE0R3C4_9TELE|nr:hypothetical protein QTP70_030969 [Hemibagrus guttatus]KAK3566177.1 hypothetical protein QTP86_028421 [Hemibagrus guttatus]